MPEPPQNQPTSPPRLDAPNPTSNIPLVLQFTPRLRSAARWLAVCALVFHVAWLPLHLTTETHCDPRSTRSHAHQNAAHHQDHHHGDTHGHSHDHDADHHHFAGDHEGTFLAKRQVLLATAILPSALHIELTPTLAAGPASAPAGDPAPPPADSSPPSGPRAPPQA